MMDKYEMLRNGVWSHYISPDIRQDLRKCEEQCFMFNSLPPSQNDRKEEILKQLLGGIGENFTIHSPFRCDFGFNIFIGRNFTGNFNLTILDEARVTIGDNVFIGPNVGIYTIIHALDAGQRNEGIMSAKPVAIGNNVWICANAVILPGVTIGDGAVIAAGSVVTRSIPPSTLAAGNPCRPLRQITGNDIIADITD